MVAVDELVETIQQGELDDELPEIVRAIRERFQLRGSWWRIDWDGLVITEDDITIDEARQIEASAKMPLRSFDPADSVTNAAAVVLVALRTRRGMRLDDASKYLQKVNSLELVSACGRFVKDGDVDPKGGSSATTEIQPDSTNSPTTSP